PDPEELKQAGDKAYTIERKNGTKEGDASVKATERFRTKLMRDDYGRLRAPKALFGSILW
ncbi:hypothetical protein A2U01_0089453, partial [Trifolium medium]|nr:hypothetical protein [Trifolium medium]